VNWCACRQPSSGLGDLKSAGPLVAVSASTAQDVEIPGNVWLYDVSSPNQPVRAGAVSVTSSVTQAGFALRLAMKGQYTEYITLHTKTKRAYVHLTPQIETILKKSGIKDGMILVSAMHITAGVYVNDHESGLIEDIDQWLEKLAPFNRNYKHHQTGEDNGDAHLKSLIIHHEVIVPVTNGKLDFGPWQQIFYAEFDGQRDKRIIVKVMGE